MALCVPHRTGKLAMSTAALTVPNRFSIITIAAPDATSPAWNARLLWPSQGDQHVTLDGGARRSIWAAQLDAAVMRADRAVVLVTEGIGCHAASWWARLSPASYVSRVAGALLFDPPVENAPERDSFASPAIALPFPSLILSGDTSPVGDGAIESWGSRLIDGHRQREGDVRPWRSAQRLVERITAKVIERDVERVFALNPLARR
jgi:predicted alpha/beta hydrolase family esterase